MWHRTTGTSFLALKTWESSIGNVPRKKLDTGRVTRANKHYDEDCGLEASTLSASSRITGIGRAASLLQGSAIHLVRLARLGNI